MVHACFVILFYESEIQTEHVGPIQYLSIVDLLFIDFFICSNLEFLVDFGNVVASGGSGEILIRNACFPWNIVSSFVAFWFGFTIFTK